MPIRLIYFGSSIVSMIFIDAPWIQAHGSERSEPMCLDLISFDLSSSGLPVSSGGPRFRHFPVDDVP
jgi:hypothetical protein